MRALPILVAAALSGTGCYVQSQTQPQQPPPAGQVDYVEQQTPPSYVQQPPQTPAQQPPQPWAQQVAPPQGQAPAPAPPGAAPTATFVGRSESAIDVAATRGNFEGARLRSGFLPDPATVRGQSGGGVDASTVSSGCVGWIARNPDHVVDLEGRFGFLRVFVQSGTDTTLVVRTPSGRFLCDDDTYGRQPALEQGSWEPGRYLVWVGSYDQGASGHYTLGLTEVASNTPAGSGGGTPAASASAAPSGGSTPPSNGSAGAYRSCEIFNGQVSHCGSWYQGSAVLWQDGAYRECDVFNGQISHCGSWYQGEAPVEHDGAWRMCDIFNGQISHCGSWYRGQAVVRR